MLLGMKRINNSLCPTSLTLSLNVVTLEPFWYPLETDVFRTQLFACDYLWRSYSSVCICFSHCVVLPL